MNFGKKLAITSLFVFALVSFAAADSIDTTLIAINNSNVESSATAAAALAAQNAWASSLGGTAVILEDFNSLGLCGAKLGVACSNPVSTAVGTFLAGGFATDTGTGNGLLSLSILNASTTPFQGRFDVNPNSPDRSGQWLDSNDVTNVAWTVSGNLTNIFFFLTDVNDQGGHLTITLNDGTSSDTLMDNYANGGLVFVGIQASSGISSIVFSNNSRHDGFGIDNIGTVDTKVPEPASLALLGTGLLAAGRKLRRKIA